MTTLLLVEDDARIRSALGMALAYLGYHVIEATSGSRRCSCSSARDRTRTSCCWT